MMNIVVNRKKKNADGKILFPALECWNPETEVMTIAATVSGNRVSCKVAYTVLKRCFKDLSDTPMENVKRYRKRIEDAARTLIQAKRFQNDGSIKIEVEDLMVN